MSEPETDAEFHARVQAEAAERWATIAMLTPLIPERPDINPDVGYYRRQAEQTPDER